MGVGVFVGTFQVIVLARWMRQDRRAVQQRRHDKVDIPTKRREQVECDRSSRSELTERVCVPEDQLGLFLSRSAGQSKRSGCGQPLAHSHRRCHTATTPTQMYQRQKRSAQCQAKCAPLNEDGDPVTHRGQDVLLVDERRGDPRKYNPCAGCRNEEPRRTAAVSAAARGVRTLDTTNDGLRSENRAPSAAQAPEETSTKIRLRYGRGESASYAGCQTLLH